MVKVKKCYRCQKSKPIHDFYKDKSKKDGLQSKCKMCHKDVAKEHYNQLTPNQKRRHFEYNNNKRQELRQEVEQYKRSIGCKYCYENEPCCLDFHHVDNDKTNNVSYLIATKNKSKVWKEVDKCVVVCSNCHRKLHAGLIT